MSAPLPSNESARLKYLVEANILDTPAEPDYDEVVQLAAAICQTPVSQITLVDEKRQWFKANFGIDSTETPRELAFCAHTILQSQPFIVPDARLDDRFADNPLVLGDPNIRFYAGFPLSTEDGLNLGTLCVIDRVPRQLNSSQQNALRVLANQVMTQIQLRRQVHAYELAMQENERVTRDLRASEERFRTFMDNGPMVSYMKDAEGRLLYYNKPFCDRFRITPEEWIGKSDTDLWPHEMAEAFRTIDLTVLSGNQTVVATEITPMRDGSIVHWNSYKFPVADAQGRTILAGMSIDMTEEMLAKERLELSQRELRTANERLNELALTDPLTGLRNRRAFDAGLEREFRRARRHKLPFSLILLDADNFKSFNDTFGHGEGDRVLRQIALALNETTRTSDLVVRHGGEEFAVLLPDTPGNSALHLAGRLCKAVAGSHWLHRAVTVSIGVAALDDTVQSPEHLVALADAALYQAKKDGKNRVCAHVDTHGQITLPLQNI